MFFFGTKLLILGVLFSTVVRAAFVAKLLILGISPLTSFILVLREALVATLVISDIWKNPGYFKLISSINVFAVNRNLFIISFILYFKTK